MDPYVNECEVGNGGCESQCCNTIGSFYCKCPDGSRLKDDGKACEGRDSTAPICLWPNQPPDGYPPCPR
uniref:EGF-like calcium-binding domain-containing protein n=1 Tax=Sphenodon punctatus TaxID=8508 RepID=A0A8D0GZ60_SPHPU